jgi:alpha-1,2-mannosyltransferase
MIQRVALRREEFNNAGAVAGSPVLTQLKLAYYRCFAVLYWLTGRTVTVTMANSTWTANHLRSLWGLEPTLVYPPCNVKEFSERAAERRGMRRDHAIVSIGQFRPEKNHSLQLQAFADAVPRLPSDTVMYLIGGVRNDEDRARVARLREEAAALGISARVEFCVSCPFDRIGSLLGRGLCGLHTMRDEHFGIVVAEYMGAGCVPLAHNSGGVAADIITSPAAGRLAASRNEFAAGIVELFTMHDERFDEYQAMQRHGADCVQRFSDEFFSRKFVEALGSVLK